jgi:hypothetical protein
MRQLLLLLSPLVHPPSLAQEPALAIRNITVITAPAPALHGATLLIRGRTIQAVGPSARVAIPRGSRIIDGQGKYLIPGLIDTHVHIASEVGKPTMDLALALELAHGVTGIRDASGIGRERELVALRGQIDSGTILAPRLYVSGSATPQNVPRYQAAGLNDLVRRLAAVGVDGLKLRNLTEVQADTVIAAARAVGLPAFGHTYSHADSAWDFTVHAVERGASGVMHATGIGPATRRVPRELAATGWERSWLGMYLQWIDATEAEEERLLKALLANHTWLEPTFTADAFSLYDEWYRGRPEARFLWWSSYDSTRAGWPAFSAGDLALARQGFKRMQRFVRRFQESGGIVLAGTDMSPWPGEGIHEELRLLVLAGLSPMAALQAATRNAARALGWEGKTGTIAVGLDADLVILDADPLQDITNTSKIWKVIRAGQVLDRSTLDSMLSRPELRRAGERTP